MTKFLKMKATDEVAELYIYGDIVSSEWDKMSIEDRCPQEIVDFIKSLSGQPLEIHINSCGGDVFGGIAMYNTIKAYKGKKIAFVDGIAASIASVITLAADDVVMLTGSQFMIHKPWSVAIGDADEMRHTANLLDGIQDQILGIYCDRAKGETAPEVINALINNETWMNGSEAAELFGFNLEKRQAAACADSAFLSKFKNAPNLRIENSEEKQEEVKDAENDLEKEKLQILINLY